MPSTVAGGLCPGAPQSWSSSGCGQGERDQIARAIHRRCSDEHTHHHRAFLPLRRTRAPPPPAIHPGTTTMPTAPPFPSPTAPPTACGDPGMEPGRRRSISVFAKYRRGHRGRTDHPCDPGVDSSGRYFGPRLRDGLSMSMPKPSSRPTFRRSWKSSHRPRARASRAVYPGPSGHHTLTILGSDPPDGTAQPRFPPPSLRRKGARSWESNQ